MGNGFMDWGCLGEVDKRWGLWCERGLCGDGSTLEGGTTRGGGTTLGGGITFGGGDAARVAYGGVIAVVVFQFVTRSRSLEIANNCSWWVVAEASLTAQDRKFRAWTIFSSRVTSGWVSYVWSILMLTKVLMNWQI